MWSSPFHRFLARRRRGVDSHEAGSFPGPARRTLALRVLSVGAALALLFAAAASARDLDTRERGLLPTDTIGIAVVDLSLSITEENYHRVRYVLRRLIAENARIGVVFFSDVPYELLPPGTPASELQPMLRLLVPPALGQPVNPWGGVFRAGTRISPALQLAKEMLERDRVRNGSILLVSDLETAPEDVPALVRVLEEIRRSRFALKVSPIAPSSDARLIFEGFLEEGAFAVPAGTATGAEPVPEGESTTALPTTLLVLGALFFLALSVHEGVAGRLAVPSAKRARRPA
jgi:von Willebrand factor type A domain